MKNKAFTLLELLVVITIIGILSSIVIVSMSGSTDSATIAKGKAYAQQVHALLGSNAVGVWNFDEGIGTTLTDISGYGNNGTLNKGANGTGLDWVPSDIEGTALQFDGVDDYVGCGNNISLNITNVGTWEVWLKSYSKGGSVAIIDKFTGYYNGYRLFYTTGSVFLQTGNGSATKNSPSIPASEFLNNIWHHIIVTKDNSGFRIYHNGIFYNLNSISDNITVNTKTLRIGYNAYNSGEGRYFNGLIDEVRIYSVVLPTTEIQKHYVQGLERLLSNQAITKTEYIQRMAEFNQSLASL